MKNLKYLIFTIAFLFTAVFSVNALDTSLITTSNNKSTFSNTYSTEEEAKNAIKEFEDYVKEKKGVLLSSKTEKIISEINKEILNDVIESDSLSTINTQVTDLEDYYASIATEDSECKVVLGELETIVTPVRTEQEESGTISAYVGNETVAELIAYFSWLANRGNYITYTTHVTPRQLLLYYESSNIDAEFLSEEERSSYLEDNYSDYDISGVELSERTDREDLENPESKFDSLDQKDNYVSDLEDEGYIVEEGTSVAYTKVDETSVTQVNETNLTLEQRNEILAQLYQNFDNVNVTPLSDTTTTQTRNTASDTFDTENEANDYIEGFKSNSNYIVVSSNVTENTTETTQPVTIKKYYSTAVQGSTLLTSYSGTIKEEDINDDALRVAGNGFTEFSGRTGNVTVRPNNNGNQRYNGTYTINSILVNGEEYTGGEIPAYAIVTVNGTVSYRRRLGGNLHTINFSKTGFLTSTRYELTSMRENGTFTDNMIEVYVAETTEQVPVTVTTYQADVEYYETITNTTYSLIGTASNNKTVYETQITAYKLIPKYLAKGIARRPVYLNYFEVTYDAVREVWTREISYRQPYSVVETKEVSYLAEAEAEFEEIKAPNTGVGDTATNYLAVLLTLVSFGTYEVLKFTLRDNK